MPVDGQTELYGILGQPVSHSLSPAMHNAAFRHLHLNKIYLPFPAQDAKMAVTAMKTLGIRGASVTIPHKQAVIPVLDTIDPLAAKIGAVNTLIFRDGAAHGVNTDWLGANTALAQIAPLAGKSALLLGAGGSARAIGFGLIQAGVSLTMASRTPSRGQALAGDLGCPWRPLADLDDFTADLLINATSVGMGPNSGQTPVPARLLTNFGLVMDIVYSPLATTLLKEAKAAGCQTVNGLEMLLYQGSAQFELWTGLKAPVKIMRQALLTRIG